MRSKARRGLSLVELVVSIIISCFIVLFLGTAYSYIYNHIITNIKLENLHLQIDYALENIRLHCISAIRVDPGSFFLTTGETKTNFRFNGESDVYNITPDNLADDACYHYRNDGPGGVGGNLILETYALNPATLSCTATLLHTERLVDSQFNPRMTFRYNQDTEPNFLTLTTSGQAGGHQVSKQEGIRFWFVDVLR